MLKVIQDQQEVAVLEIRGDALCWGGRPDPLEPEGLPDRGVDTAGVVQRGQVDKPDPIPERRLDLSGRGQRQARLPDAPRARQRHEAHRLAEEVGANGLEFALPADQWRRIGEHRGRQRAEGGRCGVRPDPAAPVARLG